jgi:25S rRNA (adenine2142-N1)-methyltransferase
MHFLTYYSADISQVIELDRGSRVFPSTLNPFRFTILSVVVASALRLVPLVPTADARPREEGALSCTMKRKHSSKPIPLAPPAMRSRKKARKVTTQFHKLTRQRDQAFEEGDVTRVQELTRAIDEMGGRAEYQRASQVSTSFFSTSKWVLGYLSRNGWIHGRPLRNEGDRGEQPINDGDDALRDNGGEFQSGTRNQQRKRAERRPTRILEVGAINLELSNAAKVNASAHRQGIVVRAIDLHAMHSEIEEADFLEISVSSRIENRYDVIVCSMVLNCVTSPTHRGDMICRLYHFLSPGGLCFLTIPRSCLTLSPHMNHSRFQEALQGTGFELLETKESPKISFFTCRRPENVNSLSEATHADKISAFQRLNPIRQGRKYTNDFSVILNLESVVGANLTFDE